MKKVNTFLQPKYHYTKIVSTDQYHNIWYGGDITKKNIMLLTRIIQEQNNKYSKHTQSTLNKYPIKLHILSDGGDSDVGMMAYDVLKQSRIPIYTYCFGTVASAATYLFLAGEKRYMTQNAKILIHQISSSELEGTHSFLKDQIYNDILRMKSIKKMYLKETNMTKCELNYYLNKDIYLEANKCLQLGFIDEIL
jgi:ATP-dependent Clp protease protease subunit